MLRPGQLVYAKCALEAWAVKQEPLDMNSITLSDKDLFEPGETVEITTWLVIPAWCPMIITGPTNIRAGKEYYRVLVPKDSPQDSRSHYHGKSAGTIIVYVEAKHLERNALSGDRIIR